MDRVVTDAQRPRVEEAAQSYHGAAQQGPPHPVDRQLAEQVFAGVHQPGEEPRPEPGYDTEPQRGEELRPRQQRVGRHREQRPAAEQRHSHRPRDRCRAGNRNEAARLPFEEQQLYREQGRGHRCAEHRRHPARGARHQERLAFGGRQVKRLGEERAEGAARHDDRPLGAERSARADRDRGRQGFEDRDLRGHAALTDQNRFECFRNAVTADPLRSEPRHEADHQSAEHRDREDPEAEPAVGG